ncbi:OmpA family protein [Aquiflexum gelatinilyticum]|uniref:OmpA family protein n=1 Tax=Aquiflexum gelatinilyticum TaxID=2961943 RepID=UPI0021684E6B|nr:OmpA family protein [Aquiflexum gelatinilyticum]MCS4436771.1 OmpA family protein [Aquiflexum gelatinilyticum]
MKISLLSLTLFFFISFSFGQGYSIIDNKAIKMHQEGDELVQKRMYDEAIEKYRASIEREAGFLESYIKWGRILLTKGKPQEAIKVAERGEARAKQAKNQIKGEFKWLKVHCYLAMGMFEESLLEYNDANPLLEPSFKQRIDYRETESQMKFISLQLEKALSIEKEKLSEPLNGFSLQYFPVLTADSKKIIFVKRDGLKNFEHEDLFTSNFSEEDQLWSQPASISSVINTNYNEGTCTISADGKILIFSSCETPDSFGDCDLYIAYKLNDEWQRPSNMGKAVNSRFWDSQPSLSADGRILFFSSNRRGGFGGRDLWYSLRMPNGGWSEAKNLGSLVNTPKDEVSPFIYFNNEILFFASDGHRGFGGQDIFVSRVENGVFTNPENLGYPINDHLDQFSLFITAQRDYAYYTENTFNETMEERSYLYKFRFPEEISLGENLIVTQGKVFNSKTGDPVDARLSLVSLSNDSTLYEFRSDGKTGEFMMLYPDKSFSGLYVEKEGYLPKIYNVDRDNLKNQKDLMVSLIPIGSGEEFVFENIFFDLDKDDLKQESASSLKRLYNFLMENPKVAITIIGHTDNQGNPMYNESLSLRRAESVKKFLMEKGIPEIRVATDGKGDREPIQPNDTPENKALNRRVTISIK